MNVLVVHNFYQQPGGEDQVFADEAALLRSHGHTVVRHTADNDDVPSLTRLTLAGRTIWNKPAAETVAGLVRRNRADVVHVHNTFPLLSMSILSAARAAGAAVVQTIHNYRPACPSGVFYRDGHVCQDCLGRPVPWPAVVHKCYRGDRRASAVAAAMLGFHHLRGTYHRDVDRFIALTDFARGKLIESGLPADRVVVKPNFVDPDPGPGDGAGGYVLFVGRLTENKGVRVLIDAWKKLTIPLKVVGDGDLRPLVEAAGGAVQCLGRVPQSEVSALMASAACLVFPSVWFEGLPKTILESFAVGTPVIASDLGSMAELVTPDARFAPGDPAALAAAVTRWTSVPAKLAARRQAVRARFERRYTAAENYRQLADVYAQAIARRTAVPPEPAMSVG